MSRSSSLAFGLELEVQPDGAEADGSLLADGESAAEVEIAFRSHGSGLDVEVQRGGHGAQGDSCTCDERFEEHVSRAEAHPSTTRCGVEPGFGKRTTRRDRARDALPERSGCAQCHQGRFRILAVALLQRLLHRAQSVAVHHAAPPRTVCFWPFISVTYGRRSERIPLVARTGLRSRPGRKVGQHLHDELEQTGAERHG